MLAERRIPLRLHHSNLIGPFRRHQEASIEERRGGVAITQDGRRSACPRLKEGDSTPVDAEPPARRCP